MTSCLLFWGDGGRVDGGGVELRGPSGRLDGSGPEVADLRQPLERLDASFFLLRWIGMIARYVKETLTPARLPGGRARARCSVFANVCGVGSGSSHSKSPPITETSRASEMKQIARQSVRTPAIATVVSASAIGEPPRADPLSGTITLGTLIFRPAGTDPKARAFPASERWTLFVGGVLTPEFGLSGGAGFNLNRKISLNAGIAFLRIDTLKAGETVGSAPVSDKPLKNGVARTVFVGFGYNF
jgi:hypothetical protein